MPQPILCLDEEVCHFAERFRTVFSKPQYQYFVTVLQGLDAAQLKSAKIEYVTIPFSLEEKFRLGHLLKVLTHLRPGLVQCYDVEGFPRTNNEMERTIRVIKMQYCPNSLHSPAKAVPTLFSIIQTWYSLGKADTSLNAEPRPNCTQHTLLVTPQE